MKSGFAQGSIKHNGKSQRGPNADVSKSPFFFFVLFVKELVSKQRLLSYPFFFFLLTLWHLNLTLTRAREKEEEDEMLAQVFHLLLLLRCFTRVNTRLISPSGAATHFSICSNAE